MKISSFSGFTTIPAAAIFICLIVLTVQISSIHEKIVNSEEQRFQSYRLVEQLRQHSEDLTRLARTFIVTGQPEFEKRYSELLAIKNSQQPRPEPRPDGTTADKIQADKGAPEAALSKSAGLEERIRALDFSAGDMALLQESRERADGLVRLEQQAFAAKKGLFDRAQDNSAVDSRAERKPAENILYSPRYQAEKIRMLEPLQRLLDSVDARTNSELQTLRARQQRYVWLILALSLAALAGVCFITIHIRKAIVQPLGRLSRRAAAIAKGNYKVRCDINTNNELATLGKHFNAMAEAINRDISDRIQAEEALRINEERWSFALEGAGEGVWDWNIETNQLMISRRASQMLGYSGSEAWKCLDEWQEQVHPQDMPHMMADLEAYLEGKVPFFTTENRVRCKDGSWKWILTRGMVVTRNADGKPLRMIGVQADISEGRLVKAQLEQSESKFRLLFERNADAILLLDVKSGRFSDCNQAAVDLLRLSQREDLLALTPAAISPERQADGMASADKAALMINTALQRGSHRFEWLHSSDNRATFPAEVLLTPIELGERPLILSVVRDITERKRAERRERWRNFVLELLAKGASLTEILNTLAHSVEDDSPAMLCSISLADSSGHHLVTGAAPSLPEAFRRVIDGIEIGPGSGACGSAAHSRQRVVIEDIRTHADCGELRELALAAGLLSCWSEPILSASWKLLGTVAIYARTPGIPSEHDIELIEHAAGLAAIAIERHRAEEGLQLASMVYQHSSEAIIVSDAHDCVIAINPAFTKLTGYTIEEMAGKKPNQFSARLQDRQLYRTIRRSLRATSTWQGEMWNRRKNGEEFTEWLTINTIRNEDRSIHRHVYLFSNITEKKRAEELIWHQANYDLLTGLPNRRLFRDRLDHEIRKAHRTGLPLALFFIDLDLFKEINDTLGHDVGDTLLIEAARRVSVSVRETDTVARLGGDEFTVILAELQDAGKIEQIARQILKMLAEPFHLGGEVVFLSASIGITLYPSDTTEPESLIKNADQAMYVAKSEGRNRYSFFTRSMQEHAQTRLRLGNDLRGALAAGQLALHFQPIIDLRNGHIIKAEALLRWNHPQRGMISPTVFIPLAEESGLINEIGDWVFRQATSWAQRWSAQLGRPFQISVNKSPVQFVAQTEYMAWPQYMEELGLPGNCITVEITEGLLLNAAPSVNEKLMQFRDAGIQVSIDDFGTGHSSMSYLKKFHIDFLKIDQSFVLDMTTDAGDRAIAEAIIVMAHKLGYKVIAEGIETVEQRDMLTAADCDYGQGFLFSKAVPPEGFEALLTKDVGY
ncbi:hypothetical protein BH11PSE11_BH11PSE11_17580 [soil metagenome]